MADNVQIAAGMVFRLALAMLTGMALYGQPLATGFARGTVLVRTAEEPLSDFTLKAANNAIYRFHCDGKTWIEREQERVQASGLRAGELLEVVSDRDPYNLHPLHYARMVQVITETRRRPRISNGLYKLLRSNGSKITETTNLTFAGIVIGLVGERMVLRTRLDGEKTIYLRPDTQCLMEGSEVDAATILPNTRVFVEVVADSNDQLEAYRVVWGEILRPAGTRD